MTESVLLSQTTSPRKHSAPTTYPAATPARPLGTYSRSRPHRHTNTFLSWQRPANTCPQPPQNRDACRPPKCSERLNMTKRTSLPRGGAGSFHYRWQSPGPLQMLAFFFIFGCKYCKLHPFAPVLHQVVGDKPFCRVLFCPKLLRDYNFESLSCVKLLGNYKLQGLALRRAIGELQFATSCFCPKLQYWGITISILSRVKLLEHYNLQGLAFCHAAAEFQFAGSCLLSSVGELQIFDSGSSYSFNTPLPLAIPVHHTS